MASYINNTIFVIRWQISIFMSLWHFARQIREKKTEKEKNREKRMRQSPHQGRDWNNGSAWLAWTSFSSWNDQAWLQMMVSFLCTFSRYCVSARANESCVEKKIEVWMKIDVIKDPDVTIRNSTKLWYKYIYASILCKKDHVCFTIVLYSCPNQPLVT